MRHEGPSWTNYKPTTSAASCYSPTRCKFPSRWSGLGPAGERRTRHDCLDRIELIWRDAGPVCVLRDIGELPARQPPGG